MLLSFFVGAAMIGLAARPQASVRTLTFEAFLQELSVQQRKCVIADSLPIHNLVSIEPGDTTEKVLKKFEFEVMPSEKSRSGSKFLLLRKQFLSPYDFPVVSPEEMRRSMTSIDGLLSRCLPGRRIPFRTNFTHEIYQSLSPEQKERAKTEGIPISSLSDSQRTDTFLFAVHLYTNGITNIRGMSPTFADWTTNCQYGPSKIENGYDGLYCPPPNILSGVFGLHRSASIAPYPDLVAFPEYKKRLLASTMGKRWPLLFGDSEKYSYEFYLNCRTLAVAGNQFVKREELFVQISRLHGLKFDIDETGRFKLKRRSTSMKVSFANLKEAIFKNLPQPYLRVHHLEDGFPEDTPDKIKDRFSNLSHGSHVNQFCAMALRERIPDLPLRMAQFDEVTQALLCFNLTFSIFGPILDRLRGEMAEPLTRFDQAILKMGWTNSTPPMLFMDLTVPGSDERIGIVVDGKPIKVSGQ